MNIHEAICMGRVNGEGGVPRGGGWASPIPPLEPGNGHAATAGGGPSPILIPPPSRSPPSRKDPTSGPRAESSAALKGPDTLGVGGSKGGVTCECECERGARVCARAGAGGGCLWVGGGAHACTCLCPCVHVSVCPLSSPPPHFHVCPSWGAPSPPYTHAPIAPTGVTTGQRDAAIATATASLGWVAAVAMVTEEQQEIG